MSGVWLAFIGWFLNQAAEASYRRVAIEKLIEGIRVGDVMDRDVPVVSPNLTLDTLVDQHLLSGQASLYPVTMDGDMLMGTVEDRPGEPRAARRLAEHAGDGHHEPRRRDRDHARSPMRSGMR